MVIDDPQMPGLIPLIRRSRPEIPIIYRSHIEIRSDLVAQKGSPQEEVWKYLWEKIRHADVFISHPMESFVPPNVPLEMVALMPACTDWLDGLNKPLKEWDLRYYHHNFRTMCTDTHMYVWPLFCHLCTFSLIDLGRNYNTHNATISSKSPDLIHQRVFLTLLMHSVNFARG